MNDMSSHGFPVLCESSTAHLHFISSQSITLLLLLASLMQVDAVMVELWSSSIRLSLWATYLASKNCVGQPKRITEAGRASVVESWMILDVRLLWGQKREWTGG